MPGGNPPEFTFHSQAAYEPFQGCALPGGGIAVRQIGPVTDAPGWIDIGIQATPGGFVEKETITGFSILQPGEGASHVAVEGWPTDHGGDTPRVFYPGPAWPTCTICGDDGFAVVLACSGSCEPGGMIGVHYIAVTEVDPTPPVVRKVEGTLLSGGVARGHEQLAATATDVGGGVSAIEVLVNGTVAPSPRPGDCAEYKVQNPSYEGEVASSPAPCPASLSGSWELDTAAFPFHEGTNTVQVCASDFATTGQPNTSCSAPQGVEVDNSCTESPVAGGQNLSADFQGGQGESITVPSEVPAEVTGDLTSASGTPISGATICVQAEVQESGGDPRTTATTTTDAGGDFSYEVPPGPNRRLLLGYRHDSFQVTKTLEFASRARPTIRLGRGRVHRGGRIAITGTVPGPHAAGRVVVLQASSLHGRRWLTFRRATTGPRGGFRASYRFGATSGTTTYRMRAVVPRQSGYPYDAGHSRPRRIKVLGRRTFRHSHGKHTRKGRRR